MSQLMTPQDYLNLARIDGVRVAYGPERRHFGDVYLPSQGDAPAGGWPIALLVHGGCWRDQFGLEPLGQLAAALAEQGVVVWNIEFRRLGGGGGWPTTFLDVARAADHIPSLRERFPIDPTRAIAVGHSAGGHLVLWLASRFSIPVESELASSAPFQFHAAVALAGIPDLSRASDQAICRGAPAELVGGAPSEFPARYHAASPYERLPLRRRQVHVIGGEDALVPASYVRECVGRANAVDDDVSLVVVPEAGHFEIVTAGSVAWPAVERAVLGAIPPSADA
ncbi:MAG: alpha/beta hydrolase [Pseudomonadota bacterium]